MRLEATWLMQVTSMGNEFDPKSSSSGAASRGT